MNQAPLQGELRKAVRGLAPLQGELREAVRGLAPLQGELREAVRGLAPLQGELSPVLTLVTEGFTPPAFGHLPLQGRQRQLSSEAAATMSRGGHPEAAPKIYSFQWGPQR